MVAWRLGKGGGGVATHAECRQPFKSGQPSLAAGHWFGRSGRVVWPAAILRAMSAPVSPSRPPPHATQAGRGGAGGALYLAHFGLQRAPFSIAPDPRALYMSERHREALAHLLYGVAGDGGFVLLTGEVGAGKTTVCRCFLEQVPADCHVAYIYNPKLTVTELLQTVCNEFHVPLAENVTVRATVKGYVDPLNAFLLGVHAAGQRCVLVIDEAQNLSASVLEQLRLLTNLETSERKLLQIILIGQPELRTLLARPELAQLAQRVVARFHLGPLDADDSAAYVRHRLAVAGLRGALPFDGATLRRIHALSGGVPRRINQLCDRALLGAYAQGRARVDRATLRRAAAEVYGTLPAPQRWRMLAVAAALLAAGAALGGWALWRGSVPAAPAALRPQPPTPAAAPAATAPAASAASAAATAAAPTPTPASAASAASPASAALATPPVASAPATTLALAAFEPDERHALAALLPLWQLPPASGDACRAAATQRVPCWRGSGLGWPSCACLTGQACCRCATTPAARALHAWLAWTASTCCWRTTRAAGACRWPTWPAAGVANSSPCGARRPAGRGRPRVASAARWWTSWRGRWPRRCATARRRRASRLTPRWHAAWQVFNSRSVWRQTACRGRPP